MKKNKNWAHRDALAHEKEKERAHTDRLKKKQEKREEGKEWVKVGNKTWKLIDKK